MNQETGTDIYTCVCVCVCIYIYILLNIHTTIYKTLAL